MHKFIKFSFNATINAFKGYQFLLVLTALATMVVFILSSMKIKLPEPVEMVFGAFYKFQSLIYKPDLSIIPVDFTLAIFAIELLIMAGLIVYVIYFIVEFEQIYDKVHQDHCQRYERSFNKKLERTAKNIENKNKSFVLYYDVAIEKIVQEFMFNEQKEINLQAKTMECRLMFKNFILQNFKAVFTQAGDKILLFFDDINEADQIFDKIYEFNAKTKQLLKSMGLKFKLMTSVCTASAVDKQETYLPKLQKLINIAVPNKIMALGDFKSKYQNLKTQKYAISTLGEYSLGADILDVYTLEPNRQ